LVIVSRYNSHLVIDGVQSVQGAERLGAIVVGETAWVT
jgi:hypothetical protein